jgi:hypothetical protein
MSDLILDAGFFRGPAWSTGSGHAVPTSAT